MAHDIHNNFHQKYDKYLISISKMESTLIVIITSKRKHIAVLWLIIAIPRAIIILHSILIVGTKLLLIILIATIHIIGFSVHIDSQHSIILFSTKILLHHHSCFLINLI